MRTMQAYGYELEYTIKVFNWLRNLDADINCGMYVEGPITITSENEPYAVLERDTPTSWSLKLCVPDDEATAPAHGENASANETP